MPLSDVSDAVYAWLEPNASQIPNLGTLYQAIPKVANESDLFNAETYAGVGIGATIYMFFVDQKERRIALGGPPPPYGGGGHKFVSYTLALLVVFKSDLQTTEAGQLAYNSFGDALTARIRQDRTAGTDAAIYGGNATATIFQWGEGDGIHGGDDIQTQHFVPKTLAGGVTLFQSLYHINVVEDLQT
jgi:hypothetical protein